MSTKYPTLLHHVCFSIALLVKMIVQKLKNTETFLVYPKKFFCQIPSVSAEDFFLPTLGKIQLIALF